MPAGSDSVRLLGLLQRLKLHDPAAAHTLDREWQRLYEDAAGDDTPERYDAGVLELIERVELLLP